VGEKKFSCRMGQKTKCDSTSDCTRFSDWISTSSSETELVGGGSLSPKLCLVWRVDCPLFTFQLDSGQPIFNASFFLFLFSFFLVQGGGLKAKSSQVSDMFPKEFPIVRVTLCVPAIDYS